uniref:KRAB domain-containing protein n=1 Tax=Monodelphis domestica TaxID=13616 RepID=A0A5F8G8U2_MONDO
LISMSIPISVSVSLHQEGMTFELPEAPRSLESVTFPDVPLINAQKSLYREVMLENYENFVSVAGFPSFKPELISQLECGKGPWMLVEEEMIQRFSERPRRLSLFSPVTPWLGPSIGVSLEVFASGHTQTNPTEHDPIRSPQSSGRPGPLPP